MSLDDAVGKFGPYLGMLLFAWPFVMTFLDRMTKSKAAHVATEDRVDEASIGITQEAMKQTAKLQDRLIEDYERRGRELEAQQKVLNAFADELKLATGTLLTAVRRIENVLVFVGDMDIRSGSYFNSIMEGITDIKAHITPRKDEHP